MGGGGAGGTVKLIGSTINGFSGTIDTTGGAGDAFAGAEHSGDAGRFIGGSNTPDPLFALLEAQDQINIDGSRDANPFISGGSFPTPFVPDLVDGAEIYGLTGLDAPTDFAAVVAAAGPNDLVVLQRLDVGPAGFDDDFLGFDMLVMMNVTDAAVADVELGVGAGGFQTDLLTRGFANNPAVGGSGGPQTLAGLTAGEVWATLVPSTITHFNISADGWTNSTTNLANGQTLAASVTIFDPADFDQDGDVDGDDLGDWQASFGIDGGGDTDTDLDSDGADFLAWQQQFTGSLDAIPAATNVPEPSTEGSC